MLVASCAGRTSAPRILPPPDLREPAGPLTRLRLQTLTDNAQLCRIVMEEAGISHTMLPPLSAAGGCGYVAAVRVPTQKGMPSWQPAGLGTSCPVAAALILWQRDVLLPAAQHHFGEPVTVVRHFGSYSCRRIYGQSQGNMSEHSRANAVDIAGFRLKSGREISLVRHWNGASDERAFLREIRDGACRTFSTVLSPDYNAAHADHFHFDQASRGGTAWGLCR